LKNENIDGRRQRMFKEDYYKELVVTSGFGVDRGSYKHEGVDYHGTKKDDVKNQIAGVVCEITLDDKYYGNHCIIKSNPKYLKGVDELFYHSYCHLFNTDFHGSENRQKYPLSSPAYSDEFIVKPWNPKGIFQFFYSH
jgi:hypothetical protein